MKTFVLAVFAAIFVFVTPAAAQMPQFSDDKVLRNGQPAPFRATKQAGEFVDFNSPSTNDIVSFGFTSDYVSVCVRGASETVYLRFATAVPTGATTITVFASGDANVSGSAIPISYNQETDSSLAAQAETPSVCWEGPVSTQGVVLAVTTSGTASVDVYAVGD